MSNIERRDFPDEFPTTPKLDVPSKMLVLLGRIDRLAETALGTLGSLSDAETVAIACAALVELRRLASEVAR